MSVDDSNTNEIADLENRLAELDQERLNVLAALEQLKRRAAAEVQPETLSQMAGAVASPLVPSNTEKITLFRSLFRGRDYVFPAGGKTQRPVSPATLPHAITNGFAASVRNLGSSAAIARTRHLYTFPRQW
jgi:hypothetical protein